MKLKHVDLFAGIGGFTLGLEWTGGFETVAFCEINEFCKKVLAKHWPDIPCHDDIRTFEYDGPVDIVTGGYPCQPFSISGEQQGEEDDRHLWPEMFSVIQKLRPTWVIGENVAGHVRMGLDTVLSDLEAHGYACRPFVIPACAIGAHHRRDRVWIMAHANGSQHQGSGVTGRLHTELARIGGNGQAVPDTERQRSQGQGRTISGVSAAPAGEWQADWSVNDGGWEPEPAVGRTLNGVPSRVDRLTTLGNAVVPQLVTGIGHAILRAHYDYREESGTQVQAAIRQDRQAV